MDYNYTECLREEVNSARQLGLNITDFSSHITRILKLLPETALKDLSKEAYEFYGSVDGNKYTQYQFVVFCLQKAELEPWKIKYDFPSQVKNSEVPDRFSKKAYDTINGRSPNGLSKVLCETLIIDPSKISETLIPYLGRTLRTPIDQPAVAAAILQCFKFNSKLCDLYKNEASHIVDHILSLDPDDLAEARAEYDLSYADLDQEDVDKILNHNMAWFYSLKDEVDTLREIADINTKRAQSLNMGVRKELDLNERFNLVESQYGILFPKKSGIQFEKDFEVLFKKAKLEKSDLLNLTPRRFEEFMAHLFLEMGYKVELTQAARDGGADLLCLRKLDGISIRFAIELKRYDKKPVDINLVKSFVASNVKFKANHLIMVTTSRFTQPAIDFAEEHHSHQLNLKGFGQIQEWFQSAGSNDDNWKLLESGIWAAKSF